LDQTTSALTRAKKLYAVKASTRTTMRPRRNQASAEGPCVRRVAPSHFRQVETEIDHIVESRQVQSALLVKSPIAGASRTQCSAWLLELPAIRRSLFGRRFVDRLDAGKRA